MLGASILVYLAIIGISLVSNLIPFAGFLVTLVLNGALVGGLWVFYIKTVRGQTANVGDAFSGFGPSFVQLMLTSVVSGLISVGVMALMSVVVAMVLPGIAVLGRARGAPPHPSTFLLPLACLLFVGVLVMIYLGTCWAFALPLVGDKGLKFWPAMELSRRVVSKHWWMTFWMFIVVGFLGMAGMLACGVGILVAGPVAFALLACHYQKVFGDLAPGHL
jgi:hypothetical protein